MTPKLKYCLFAALGFAGGLGAATLAGTSPHPAGPDTPSVDVHAGHVEVGPNALIRPQPCATTWDLKPIAVQVGERSTRLQTPTLDRNATTSVKVRLVINGEPVNAFFEIEPVLWPAGLPHLAPEPGPGG